MRRFCALLLASVLTLTAAVPALAAEETVPAKEAPMYFRVDGKLCPYIFAESIDDSGMAYHIFLSYLIDQEHYVQLRQVAVVMGFSTTPFDVQYDAAANSVEIIPGAEYTGEKSIPSVYTQYIEGNTVTAHPSVNPISVKGAPREVTAYVIDGHNYMRLRDIADLAGFSVSWNQQSGTVGLWSGLAETPGVHAATVDGSPEDDHVKGINARVQTTPNYLNAPPTCSLYDSGNGTVTVVDASLNTIWSDDFLNYGPVEVSVYDTSDFSRISTMTLPEELPMYGAFLHGEAYNYILYGQENPDEDDGLEVLRVVKYDQNWNRLGAVGVYGDRAENQMTSPFYSGGAAMVESGGELIVHTARTNYTSYDGMRHQDSTTLGFNMDKYTQSKGAYGWGTSHSLGTDIIAGKNSYVTVDVSDGGRRALTFYRAGTEPFSYPDDSEAAYLFPQPGTGIPGLTYGDAAATSTHYIAVAGERDPDFWLNDTADSMFNVVVAAVPMNNVSTTASKEYVVGQYWKSDKSAFLPTVAGLPDGRAIVLWQEYEAYDRNGHVYSNKPLDVKYVVLNKDGSPSDVTGTLPGYSTSTCQPTVVDDQLVWYANMNNTRYFYTLPLADL